MVQWYRAAVVDILKTDAKVELVDLAIVTTLPMNKLRLANTVVMKDPVVAVSCCLKSWVGEDKKKAVEKWGEKMGSMSEQYSEIYVEVVEVLSSQVIVKIPMLEQKFVKKEMSRAEMLKMKLMHKK